MVKIKRRVITIESESPKHKKRTIGAKVDEQLWLRLRALAIKQGRLSGDMLDEAINQYLERNEH